MYILNFMSVRNYVLCLHFCMKLYKLSRSGALDKFHIVCYAHILRDIEGRKIRTE